MDIESYIQRSQAKIQAWNEELKKMRLTEAKKECDILYNKITALQSRLRHKIAENQLNQEKNLNESRFEELCSFLSEQIQPECQERIIKKLKADRVGKHI